MKKILSLVSIVILSVLLISCQELFAGKHTANEVLDMIEITYANGDSDLAVTSDLVLPALSLLDDTAEIVWESSNAAVIDTLGVVNRQDEDTLVTLQITVYLGTEVAQKQFNLMVLAGQESYTVTFKDGNTVLYSFSYKDRIFLSDVIEPTHDDLEFLGWTLTPSGTDYFTFNESKTGDFTLYAQWKTPGTDPIIDDYTYEGYYLGAAGLTGTTLKSFLRTVVTTGIVGFDYEKAKTVLPISDRDVNNTSNVIQIYTGASVQGLWSSGGTIWNREHVWPQSLLGVSAGSSVNAASDIHNLKPASPSYNSSRGNKYFDDATTTVAYEPRDEVKGDVARILFYMAVRYDNLNLINGTPTTYQMAMLNTLLQWNIDDPVDSFEQNRNNVIFSYQKNYNPFIDHPEFAQKIWGSVTLTNNTTIFLQVETSSYLFMNRVIQMPQEVRTSYTC